VPGVPWLTLVAPGAAGSQPAAPASPSGPGFGPGPAQSAAPSP
jgi:hypothetical protein